jgi:hypothetical protein
MERSSKASAVVAKEVEASKQPPTGPSWVEVGRQQSAKGLYMRILFCICLTLLFGFILEDPTELELAIVVAVLVPSWLWVYKTWTRHHVPKESRRLGLDFVAELKGLGSRFGVEEALLAVGLTIVRGRERTPELMMEVQRRLDTWITQHRPGWSAMQRYAQLARTELAVQDVSLAEQSRFDFYDVRNDALQALRGARDGLTPSGSALPKRG